MTETAVREKVRVPKPTELLPLIEQAKVLGRNHIRFKVPASNKFGVLRKTIWGGTSVRVVDHSNLNFLVVECHIITVLAAARRQLQEEREAEERPLPINQLGGKTRFDSRR